MACALVCCWLEITNLVAQLTIMMTAGLTVVNKRVTGMYAGYIDGVT